MRILLDECLPRPLKHEFVGHDVVTVPEMGWGAVKNGALLRLAEPLFDVFVTIDGNLRFQQQLHTVQLRFIVLVAVNNKLETLRPLIPSVLTALETIQTGDIIRVSLFTTAP